MPTDAPEKPKKRTPAGKTNEEEPKQDLINDDDDNEARNEVVTGEVVDEEEARRREAEEAEAALEALDPSTDARRWVIGKPPQEGGKDTQYSVYIQRPMAWMPRQRFFALLGKTMSQAIRATGGSVGGMSDIFGDEGGSLVERGRRLSQRDFQDASSFFSLAMELIGYSPDFLLESYILWLDVPRTERTWAKTILDMPYCPEEDKWGLREGEHLEIIQTFIDQNYEDIRRFFIETLPDLGRRVALHEKSKIRTQGNKAQESE